MHWFRANLPITVALALSLALHLLVVFPALGILGDHGGAVGADDASLTRAGASEASDASTRTDRDKAAERAASNSRRTLQERRERERAMPSELREREDEIRLGIDKSDAVTMNWIGYDQYEQHLAELAEVEQAAFRLRQASGSRGSASPLLPPTPPQPSVASSPNPADGPLHAASSGADSTAPTNLVAQPTPEPSSRKPAMPPTDPLVARGADPDFARPLPPPESREATTPASEAGPRADDPAQAGNPDAPPVNPAQPNDGTQDPNGPPQREPKPEQPDSKPPADGGEKPAPQPPDPTKTDPRAEPRTDPETAPDPVEALKPRNPAEPGQVPDAPPRVGGDPAATTIKPPEDAPVEPRDPNAPRSPENDSSQRNPAGDTSVAPARGQQSGGMMSTQPTEGSNSNPAPPSPAGEPGDSQSKIGELSDSESDPTSLIEVPMTSWRNGKPLAAKGIELKPVRPRFTILNRLDGIGRNPIGELVIGREGIPQVARIVRSTGNPGVDEAIRSALFKWRASGEQLEKLRPGQTVTIRLRLIMLAD